MFPPGSNWGYCHTNYAPVLHVFDSERRSALAVKPGVPFYEESTFWNPSWTTIEGAVKITDITDLSISIEAAATGKLLSRSSSRAQIAPNLVGFSHPIHGCSVCRPQTAAFSYGLGAFLLGPWISQSLGFAGASGVTAYLPSQKLTISIEVTNGPDAYNDKGDAKYGLPAGNALKDLADALAPHTFPMDL